METKIKVVFFQRKPLPFHKSIEAIFDDVRRRMPSYVECVVKVFSVYSKGIVRRLVIMWEAYTSQGDVNHITGDIHFSAIWLKRNKTMLTVHDCGMLSNSKGLKHQLLKYFWFTLPLSRCSLVTVVSEATRQDLLKFTNYRAQDIKVIPNAISPLYRYDARPFNKAKPVILQVGTKINKNISRLAEALHGLDCSLVIIGIMRDDLKDKLAKYRISYFNLSDLSTPELVEQYKNCDILSFVSTYEGFGMPILEANATGRPVITSNLLSMPEVAGDAACLVNPYDVQQIREGILKIIEDDEYRNDLVRKGIENAKRFDPQLIAIEYLKLYKKISLQHS